MLHPSHILGLCLTLCRLCDVRFTTVKANIDLSNVTIQGHNGDFNANSLAHVINKPTINKLVVQSWLEKACKLHSSYI
jgi:ATP-dependent helicase IRC3